MNKIFLTCMFLSTSLFAAEGDLKKVEDILDRLEKKILDKESSSMQFGDQPVNNTLQIGGGTIELPPAQIKTNLSEDVEIKEISNAASAIEQQLEKLESEVQKTRQKVLESSNARNHISMILRPLSQNESYLRSARVVIDGYEIYEVSQPAGIWNAGKPIALYSGPIKPGAHKIEVEVSVIHRNDVGLAINADSYQNTKQTFNTIIKPNQPAQTFEISITKNADRGKISLAWNQKVDTIKKTAKNDIKEAPIETKEKDGEEE